MIQVHIDDRFEINGLAIHVYEKHGNHVQIWTPDGFGRTEIWREASVMPTYPFKLPREAAGPLFAALGRVLGSVENPEALRKDYEAERARVDKLIDAAIMGMPVVRR